MLRNCKPELAQALPSVVPGEMAAEQMSAEEETDALNNLFTAYRAQHQIAWFESDGFEQFAEAHGNTRRMVADLLDNRYHPYMHEWLNGLKQYLESCEPRGRLKGYLIHGNADGDGYFRLDDTRLQILRGPVPVAVHGWCGFYGVLTRVGWAIHDGFEVVLKERLVSSRKRLIIEHWPTSGILRLIE